MARQGSTTAAGLGWQHQRAKKAALAVLRDGTPCPFPFCGHAPMYRDPARNYDRRPLDYDDYPGRMFGGPQIKRLAHARCNRRAGAIMGNKLRSIRW